jgi:hypothetical protein
MSLARHLVLALTSCACFASTAMAAQSVHLKVAFHPDQTGAPTTIELGFRVSASQNADLSPVTSLDLHLPAHMGITTTTLGQSNCYPENLIYGGLQGCSANARIGFGDATAVVPIVGSEDVQEQASLTALMGPPAESRLEILFYAEALSPVFAQFVFPGVVLSDTKPYGEQISTAVPLLKAWPEGPYVALETFNSTIGPLHLTYHRQVSGRTISYQPHGVTVPRRCPRGGYPFAVELHFQDGSQASAHYNVACPKPQIRAHNAASYRSGRQWAIQDSNLGPLPYQRSALTN